MRRASILAALILAGAFLTVSCGGGGAPADGALSSQAARGKTLFSACAICHAAAPPESPAAQITRTGPNLYGVYGAPAARLDYAYTPALRSAGLVWDEPTLEAFLAAPQKLVPGARMVYVVPNAAERQAIIAYLKTLH